MARNVVAIDNMKKHMTLAEKRARQEAEASMFRQKIRLTEPSKVKEDEIAHRYWLGIKRKMKGISLLDDLDADMLGEYCIMSARRDRLAEKFDAFNPVDFDLLRLIQAQERIVLTYASKLGLTAESRARLAKKKAEERQVEDDDLFD